MSGYAIQSRVWQLIAAVAGLAVFALVFAYTGDADLWSAIVGGAGTAIFFLIAAHQQKPRAPNGDS